MKKKILCTAACAAVWSACLMLPAAAAGICPAVRTEAAAHTENESEKAGLVKEGGSFRYYEDGKPVTERWVTAEGHTYYFDGDGNASVLKCRIDGSYYVFDKDGRLLLPSVKKVVRVETPDGEFQTYYVDTEGKSRQRLACQQKVLF